MNIDLFAILHSMPSGVVMADLQSRVIFTNSSAREILGVDPTNDVPDTWSDHYGLFLPDKVTPFPTEDYPLVRATRGEVVRDVEMWVRNPGVPHGRLISVTGRPLISSAGFRVGGAVIFRDITALRAMERLKDDLVALIVHDIRSPLTTVTAEADLLILEEACRGPHVESLHAIRDAGWRAHRMAMDLLDIHLAEDGALQAEKRELPVGTFLDQLRSQMRLRAERAGQRIDTVDAPAGLTANMDRNLMMRVIQNLVDNCLKYGAKGGTIRLEAKPWRGEAAVLLHVRDDGPGVPPGLREKIFEKYAQVERDESGRVSDSRGLGLQFCRVAVQAHGGRIWVEDNAPKGACFSMELPRM